MTYIKQTGVLHCKIKVEVILWHAEDRIAVNKLLKYNQLDANNILVWNQKSTKREAKYSRCETCRLKNLSTIYRKFSWLLTQTLPRKAYNNRPLHIKEESILPCEKYWNWINGKMDGKMNTIIIYYLCDINNVKYSHICFFLCADYFQFGLCYFSCFLRLKNRILF